MNFLKNLWLQLKFQLAMRKKRKQIKGKQPYIYR